MTMSAQTAAETAGNVAPERKGFELEDTGFKEVPKKYRRFYRKWQGEDDMLAENEVLCPVCRIVVRSAREVLPGDRVYCMPCMTRLMVTDVDGRLIGRPLQ